MDDLLAMADLRLAVARADALATEVLRRPVAPAGSDAWASALSARRRALSSLAFLDAARAADRLASSLARRAATSGACE